MYTYRGYTGVWEYDTDLETFAGHVVHLRDQVHFEGTSVEELHASMHRAVDHYLSVCEERGEDPDRPFSGRFNVRLNPALHRKASTAAAISRKSMNEWVSEAVDRKVREDLKPA